MSNIKTAKYITGWQYIKQLELSYVADIDCVCRSGGEADENPAT